MIITANIEDRLVRLTRTADAIGIVSSAISRTISGGVNGPVTDEGANVIRQASATVVTDYDLSLAGSNSWMEQAVWTSNNEGVATVSADGYVSHVSDGVATITAVLTSGKQATIDLVFSEEVTVSDVLVSYVAGSFAAACFNGVKSLAEGKSASDSNLFTVRDHANSVYTRNPNAWTNPVDFTGCAVYTQTQSPDLRAATLIAPDVVVLPEHYETWEGHEIRFVTPDNRVISRTLVKKLSMKSFNGTLISDISLARLSSPVPSTIKHYKILPSDFLSYLKVSRSRPIPVLDTVKQRTVGISMAIQLDEWTWADFAPPAQLLNPLEEYAHWQTFSQSKVSGDSGNPAFLVVNGELVLLGGYTYPTRAANLRATGYYDAINAMMTAIGSVYQLTEYDLSNYSDYSVPVASADLVWQPSEWTLDDAGRVSSLADRTGTGGPMTQATESRRPMAVTDEHGVAWLEFDGVDDSMAGSTVIPEDISSGTLIMVTTPEPTTDYQDLVRLGNGERGLYLRNYAAENWSYLRYVDSALKAKAFAQEPYDGPVLLIIRWSGKDVWLQKVGQPAVAWDVALAFVASGSTTAQYYSPVGKIARDGVLLWNRPLTDPELADQVARLNASLFLNLDL